MKAEDAGTYVCTVTNNLENIEIPTVLVVTGVVPYFSQAPESFIALPPLPDSYLKFNIEISFKPESYDGIILYNDESNRGNGDFILLSLVGGYPVFRSVSNDCLPDQATNFQTWNQRYQLLRNKY